MEIEFIWTIFGSIFFSVAAGSLLWKNNQIKRGFFPVVMMVVMGFLMLLIYQWINPAISERLAVVKVLYNACLSYFVIQWFWVLNYVRSVSNINTQE